MTITGTLTQPAYVIAQYGSLTGTPLLNITGTNLPNNYVLQPNYLGLHEMALVNVANPITQGDWNRDGLVTSADINAGLKALADLKVYQTTNFLSNQQLAIIGDYNSSGTVTNGDIQGLLDAVAAGGGGSVAAVPEPTSIVLLAFGGLALAMAQRRRCVAK